MSRRIVVTKTHKIRDGEKNGKTWTLWGVEADDQNGNPIPEQLKTFATLPLGEVEVDVEVQTHEQYGTSYLLKPVGGGNGGGGGTGRDQQLAELRERIARLESEVKRLSGVLDRREPGAPPLVAAASAPVGAIPDDDIPF